MISHSFMGQISCGINCSEWFFFEPLVICSKSVISSTKCYAEKVIFICFWYHIFEKFKLIVLFVDREFFLLKIDIDVLDRFTSMCQCLQNSSRPFISFCSPDGVSDASIRSSAKSRWQTVIVPTFIPFDLSRYSLRSSRKKLKSVGLIISPCNTPYRFSNISLNSELYFTLLLELSNISFMTLKYFPRTPFTNSLYIKAERITLSNADLKSM